MCGIVGQTSGVETHILSAARSIAYRGPDADGFFSDGRVSFGHRRLSIIDVDARANQPLSSSDGVYTIVYNGEIYNYRELRATLSREHGVQFRTESDTEMLIEGYRHWREGLLPRLRGMFAFAIYDTAKGEVFLARDHAGIKPLYVARTGGQLYFASEAKAVASLLRADGVGLEASEDAIGLFLALGYLPTPFTLCREISKLPRSSWLRYRLSTGAVETGEWTPNAPVASSVAEMQRFVRDSVVEHTIADVPVGVFFSGGVDSSVVALALRDAGMRLSTYSVRVEGRNADEPYFRAIASALSINAQVHNFGVEEFDEVFEHVLAKMDDPIADPSIYPTAFIARIAARDVKVVLSGEGGDELFFGYPRAIALARMRARAERFGLLEAAMLRLPVFRGKRALAAKIAHATRKPVWYYLTQTALTFGEAPVHSWRAAHEALAAYDPRWLDRDSYLEHMLMRKGDMATMYASLEGRVPLLGAQVWQSAPRFVDENLKSGKDILKDMLRSALPDDLIDRPKSGFGIPLTRLRSDSRHVEAAIDTARRELSTRYPQYASACAAASHHTPLAFGLVALHRSLRNLGL